MSKSGWRSQYVTFVFLFLISAGLHAQSQSPGDSLPRTPESQSTNASDSLPPSNDTTSSPSENSPYGISAAQRQQAADAEWSLPASRILDLLQQRPEVAVELKQLLAEKYRDAGLPIQDDGISDEMLYRRITGDPSFRASATLLLEARGYVTEDDIRETPGLTGVPMNSRMDQSLSSQTALPTGNSASGAGLLSGDAEALSSIDRANLSGADIDLAQQLDRMQFAPQQNGQEATQQTQRQNGTQQRFSATPQRTPQTDRDRTKTDTGPELLHKPTPYNLLALHDLYTQVPAQQQTLTRFGADVFVRRSPMGQTASSSAQASALDLPIGPDYVLGPGDGLSITIWGGVSQTLSRTVDASGKIALPEVGPVALAGTKLGQAQEMLQRILAPQFRSAHVDVTLARLRTVRVYVVGDVQRPGAYDLHSLSSPLNALYAAGGPTSVGSLRTLRHMRGATVVSDIDL
jgi:Polysaccharide biosynthesis/export protein